jgi:hypothetical protein
VGVPSWIVVVLIGIPIVVVLSFTALSFRNMTPLAFRCVRCDREFRRKPWKRFPARCPTCHADDWNRDA